MKRILPLLMLLCLPLLPCGARPVAPTQSKRAAAAFWNSHCRQNAKPVDTLMLRRIELSDYPHLHVYSCSGGFVVVAADDCVRPILAYSPDHPFPTTPHPPLRWWLAGCEARLDALADLDLPSAPSWETTESAPDYDTPRASQHIGPLMNTFWNQTAPYNGLCPYNSDRRERTVVGCVATAMAQIMKYWGHPLCGSGSHSYRYRPYGTLNADFASTSYLWEYMPMELTTASESTSLRTLQTLSYHCGVAVEMMYGPASTGGSGAYSNKVPTALTRYFKYDPNLVLREREDFTDSTWTTMILADLNARRPIYYTGRDSTGGHAFVLDGADTSGRYHFNWGWGGYGDGYFALDNLAPTRRGTGTNASNTFNLSQSAIFGIQPLPQHYDTVDYYDTICSTTTVYQFHDYTLAPRTGDLLLHHLDTFYRVHVAMAPRRILYFDPNGGEGEVFQETYCYLTGARMPECPFARAGLEFAGWSLSETDRANLYHPGDTLYINRSCFLFAIWQVPQPTPPPDTTASQTDSLGTTIALHPNPTTKEVEIHTGTADPVRCTLHDAVGRYIGQFTIEGGSGKINLEGLPRGIYLLRIDDGEHTINRCIIKQ